MKNLEYIYKHKKSDIAAFLGSGSSINNITDEQWKKIATVDTWTVNNWLYHPFVPKFYHVELKKYDKDIFKRRKIEKQKQYKDTIFIINKNRIYLLDAIGSHKFIYGYNMVKINKQKKAIVPKYKMSEDPNVLTCNLNSSLTMILELFYRFKYKRVIFFGVDLHNSLYFWTGKPKYGETHCQWNKDHEGRQPEDPHNTAHVKNFVIWFSEKRMKEVGGEFFVGYKDTLLYPDLKYFDIKELKDHA